MKKFKDLMKLTHTRKNLSIGYKYTGLVTAISYYDIIADIKNTNKINGYKDTLSGYKIRLDKFVIEDLKYLNIPNLEIMIFFDINGTVIEVHVMKTNRRIYRLF